MRGSCFDEVMGCRVEESLRSRDAITWWPRGVDGWKEGRKGGVLTRGMTRESGCVCQLYLGGAKTLLYGFWANVEDLRLVRGEAPGIRG